MKKNVRLLICGTMFAFAGVIPSGAYSAETGKILFHCDLTPDEVARVSDSTASGRVGLSLDRTTQTLSWNLNYTGLSSPPANIAIHGPAIRGAMAKVLKTIGEPGAKAPVTGSWVLDDGELELLLQRQMYIQIDTAGYSDGEVRCQIDRGASETPRKP